MFTLDIRSLNLVVVVEYFNTGEHTQQMCFNALFHYTKIIVKIKRINASSGNNSSFLLRRIEKDLLKNVTL